MNDLRTCPKFPAFFADSMRLTFMAVSNRRLCPCVHAWYDSATARCVLPSPGGPRKIAFAWLPMKSRPKR